MFFKLFWYQLFVHWKLKLLNFIIIINSTSSSSSSSSSMIIVIIIIVIIIIIIIIGFRLKGTRTQGRAY